MVAVNQGLQYISFLLYHEFNYLKIGYQVKMVTVTYFIRELIVSNLTSLVSFQAVQNTNGIWFWKHIQIS